MSQEQLPKTKTGTKTKQTLPVAERLVFFNKQHPNGCIWTEQVEMLGRPFYRATVTPDVANPARFFTGHAPAISESRFNFRKTHFLEGAEESAVALALSLVLADKTDHVDHNEPYMPKTGVCQECGLIWNKADDQGSNILGTCPECRIKKRLFSKMKVH